MLLSRRKFLLDTDVILSSPFSILSFDEHEVILADATIEDLNTWKEGTGEKSRNAREALRLLEDMLSDGNLTEGVPLKNGGLLRVVCKYSSEPIPIGWDANDRQVRVLRACKSLERVNVTFVTNNMAMRLRADMLGIRTEPFKTKQMAELNEQYTGRGILTVQSSLIDRLYSDGAVSLHNSDGLSKDWLEDSEFVHNKYFVLVDVSDGKHTGLAQYKTKYRGQDDVFVRVEVPNAWGVKPRNVGQKFALHALMAPASEVPCVILKGGAGTGKTMLSLAAALQGVLEDKTYTRCLTSRPNFSMDRELGYLKGSEEEKIGPLIRPIMDNLEQLTKYMSGKTKDGIVLPSSYAQKLYDEKVMVSQAFAYMRGRSIADQFVIIDEAQNMSALQAFSIISRAGSGCKIVLCGDVEQIDNIALDSRNNGLTYASEKLKGSSLVAQVTFEHSECERSPLASEALRLMSPKGY